MLAQRYARAIFALAKDHNEQDVVFEQMRVINSAFQNDKEISEFLSSPMIRPTEKVEALEKVAASLTISPLLKSFLLLLGKKGRLGIFDAIQTAYQKIADEEYGVTRGTVRSATVLPPEERKRLETLVGKATRKQVILNYKEDPELLGGMVAEVGSFTFDDSLTSHLKRINEQLTRSTQ